MTKAGFKSTVDGMLDHYWHNLMDDCSEPAAMFAQGIVEAVKYLGFISEVEAEGWIHRMKHCPEIEEHFGGRAWCAYCGSIATNGLSREDDTNDEPYS